MECISAFGLSQSGIKYTEKQKKLIEECDSVILQEGIDLYIDKTPIPVTGVWSLDVEHNEQGVFVGIGLSHEKVCPYFTKIDKWLATTIENLQLIMHNGVSDIECLRTWGVNVRDEQLIHDTMLIGHLLDSSLKSYGLKDMTKRELGIIYPSYEDIVGKRGLKTPRITLDKQPLELVSKYCSLDAYAAYRLYERQKKATGL